MKKIAIVTLYFESENFGGNLQSYALSYWLNKNGYIAEQLSFSIVGRKINKEETIREKLKSKGIRHIFSFLLNRIFSRIDKYIVNKDLKIKDVECRRKKAFLKFNETFIPHSKEIYNEYNAAEAIKKYDLFVVGSDQIWNLSFYNPIFFLDYNQFDNRKISYAASLGISVINEEDSKIYKSKLRGFKAISVREKDAVELLDGLAPVNPIQVVDPVLLLNKNEWDEICAERVVQEKYIYCYFLGDNKKARKLLKQFAKLKGLKIVTVPYAGASKSKFHKTFGDFKLYDTTPQEFISLIKHAEYIFTDSFHAVVFSHIYNKQYFVFNRDKKGSMNSRIYSITELFDSMDRFCYGKDRLTIKYIKQLKNIEYSKSNNRLDDAINKSKEFLFKNIGNNE